jgi:serine/threonine protein kinase/Tol biopolymer transport system component
LIGSTISRYRVLERLGGGGAGVVFKAEDLKLERLVALKFLSTYRSDNEADKRRFLREARASSILDHPNICTVYEIDETDDGRLFIAMAFCEGETLKRKVEREPLAIAEGVRIAAQIASGLAAAHAKGIVHRDVKPANVIVGPDGRLKIVDFGIAKLADQSRLTRDGTAVGTAGYMAPEQIRGEAIDPRTDVWSLGVVLYEMITGRTPFPGDNDHERIRNILSRTPDPVSRWRPGTPPALERIVARALAKRPAERFPDMEAMRAELDALAFGLGTAGPLDGLDLTLRDIPSLSSAMTGGTGGIGGIGGTGGIGGIGGAAGTAGTAVTEDTSQLVGRTLAHYRVLEYIGGGGMGVVYKAEDLRLARSVALKFLPPELTRDAEAKARFLQEARAASGLDHPNICTIHEVGETDDGRLYLAMPSYDGETLRRRIERGPLAIEEAIDIAEQIARGLAKAHRGGIVHRDIKPANLIVTDDGVVKILDFGLAKLVGAAAITRTGSSVGTPAYMSPEQARGEEVDHRTDLWSFGIVLYEMVAGRRPFRGDHDQAVLYGILNEAPKPLAELRPEAPPELGRIVEGLLSKDPADRYPTAEGPLGDLRALRSNPTMTTTVRTETGPPPSGVRPWMLWAVILGAVAVLAAGALYLSRAGGRGGRGESVVAGFKGLTELEGSESYPSLSSDGERLLYVKSINGNADIYLQIVKTGVRRNLTAGSPADDTQPAFSPDGRQVAFRSEREGGGLFVMNAEGGAVTRLTFAGYHPAWSPDRRQIAFSTEGVIRPQERRQVSQLWVVDVGSKEKRLLTPGDAVQPSWSPDGGRIAYWGLSGGGAQRVLWTVPAGGGAPVEVRLAWPLPAGQGASGPATRDDALNWNPVWSSDGKFLYFVSNHNGSMNLWRVPIDEASGRVRGEPQPITSPARSLGFLSVSGPHVVYATDEGKSSLERWPFDLATFAVGAPQGIEGPRAILSAAVSPDGKSIVYGTSAPKEDLFVARSDGSEKRQLTNDNFKNRVPLWTADGAQIVFYSDRGGSTYGAWAIRPDASGRKPLPHEAKESLYDPTPSPDGHTLVASLKSRGAVLIDLDQRPGSVGRVQELPSPGDDKSFAASSWSPDGTRLAGALEFKDGPSLPGIVVYSLKTRTYERLTPTGSLPQWLRDGRTLLYLDEGKIFRCDLASKASHLVLVPPPGSVFHSISLPADDRMLYALETVQEGDIQMLTLSGD